MSLSNTDLKFIKNYREKNINTLTKEKISDDEKRELYNIINNYVMSKYENLRTITIKYSLLKKTLKDIIKCSDFLNMINPDQKITDKVRKENENNIKERKYIEINLIKFKKTISQFSESKKYEELFYYLSFICGRRPQEIIKGEFKIIENKSDIINFKGIKKKRNESDIMKVYKIKLIEDSNKFLSVLEKFKELTKKLKYDTIRKKITSNFKKHFYTFGLKTIHILRSSYAEYLYLFKNEKKIIKPSFISSVLLHKDLKSTPNYSEVKFIYDKNDLDSEKRKHLKDKSEVETKKRIKYKTYRRIKDNKEIDYNKLVVCYIKKYRYFLNIDNVEQLYKIVKQDNINEFYEIIRKEKICRPYFDYEYKTCEKYTEELEKEDIRTLKKDIKEVFKKKYNEIISGEEIYITRGSRKDSDGRYKISFHIVISTKNNLVFEHNNKKDYEKNDLKNNTPYILAHQIINNNKEFYTLPFGKNKFDLSVYSKNRLMRCLLSDKGGNTTKLIPIDDNLNEIKRVDKEKYFISLNLKNYKLLKNDLKDVDLKILEKKNMTNKKVKEINIKDLNDEIKNKINNRIKMYGSIKGYDGENFYINFKSCCICGNEKCKEQKVLRIMKCGQMILRCLSNNSKIDLKKKENGNKEGCYNFRNIGNLEDKEVEYDDKKEIDKKYILDLDKDGKLSLEINKDDTKENKKMKEYLNEYINCSKTKILKIKSSCGSGKSAVINLLIKQLLKKDSNLRILYVTYRRSLANDFYSNLKDLDMKLYSSVEGDLSNVDRLIIQLESLYKLFINNEYSPYDIIVLDESESLLNQFSSSTVKDKRYLYNRLKELIRFSKKTLLMDADIDFRSSEFVEEYKSKIIINKNNALKRNITILRGKTYDTTCQRYIEICTDIKNNKNVVIVCLSKKYANKLHVILNKIFSHDGNKNSKYGLCLNSDTDQKLLALESSKYKKYNWLIYTSTIEAGNNIDYDHFDRIYLFLSLGCTHQRGVFQMIKRARKIKDINIRASIICSNMPLFNTEKYYSYEKIEDYYKYIKNMKIQKNNLKLKSLQNDFFKGLEIKEIKYDVKENKVKHIYNYSSYDKLFIRNILEEQNKQSEIYMPKFVYEADKRGIKIFYDMASKMDFPKKYILSKNKLELYLIDEFGVFNILKKSCITNKESSEEKVINQKILYPTLKEKMINIDKIDMMRYNNLKDKQKAYDITLSHKEKSEMINYVNFKMIGIKKNINSDENITYIKNKKEININLREYVYENFIDNNGIKAIRLKNYLSYISGKKHIINEDYYNLKRKNKKKGLIIDEKFVKTNKKNIIKYKLLDDILKIMGIKLFEDSGLINNKIFSERMEKCLKESLYYKNFNSSLILFGFRKLKFPSGKMKKMCFSKQLARILDHFGIIVNNLDKHKGNYEFHVKGYVLSILKFKKKAGEEIYKYKLIDKNLKQKIETNINYKRSDPIIKNIEKKVNYNILKEALKKIYKYISSITVFIDNYQYKLFRTVLNELLKKIPIYDELIDNSNDLIYKRRDNIENKIIDVSSTELSKFLHEN